MPRFFSDKRTPIPKVKKKNYSLKMQMKKESKEILKEATDSLVEPYYTFYDERGIATFNCGCKYAGTEINIPTTIENNGKTYKVEIGFLAFRECNNLKEIIIPEGCERLLRSTFLDCSNLERVFIPSSIKIIFPCQFVGCENLKEIIFQNPEGIKMKDDVFCTLSHQDVKVIDQSMNKEYTLGEFIKKFERSWI